MAVGEVSSPGAAALAENLVGLSAGNGEQQQQLAGRDELQLSKKCASLLLSKKARKAEKRKEKLEEERRLREEAKRKKTHSFYQHWSNFLKCAPDAKFKFSSQLFDLKHLKTLSVY